MKSLGSYFFRFSLMGLTALVILVSNGLVDSSIPAFAQSLPRSSFLYTHSSSRQKVILDSIIKQIKATQELDTLRVHLLVSLASEQLGMNAEQSMKTAEQALEAAKKQGFRRGIALAKNAVGVAARVQGLYAVAASLHFDALDLSKKEQDEDGIARALHNIGRVYEAQRESGKALEYLRPALAKREQLASARDIAETMHYMGNCFGNRREYDSAMHYYTRAMRIRSIIREKRGIAVLTNNVGWIFRLQQRYDTALTLFRQAYSMFDSLEDIRGKALALDNIGIIYFRQKKFPESIQTLTQALHYAEISHDRREINDLYAALANSHEAAGQFREANTFRRLRDALKDSLFNERSAKLVAELNARYEDEKQEQQIAMLQINAERNRLQQYLWGVLGLLGVGAIGVLLHNNRNKSRINAALEQKNAEVKQKNIEVEQKNVEVERYAQQVETVNTRMLDINHELATAYEQADRLNEHLTDTLQDLQLEKANSDKLLLNILPAAIAERLKNGEHTFAQRYSGTTILFADLVGFTQIAASMAPEELVQILSEVFVLFDNVLERNGCEKIKTIGDCYMIASGLPHERPDHALVAARTAFELLSELEKFNETFRIELRLRIGMHTGPVVAGVIGKKKFAFDIWGDTVNVASRMESHGEAGRIHCTEEVRLALQEHFLFEERGEMEIKGRGVMNTCFLVGEVQKKAALKQRPLSLVQ